MRWVFCDKCGQQWPDSGASISRIYIHKDCGGEILADASADPQDRIPSVMEWLQRRVLAAIAQSWDDSIDAEMLMLEDEFKAQKKEAVKKLIEESKKGEGG